MVSGCGMISGNKERMGLNAYEQDQQYVSSRLRSSACGRFAAHERLFRPGSRERLAAWLRANGTDDSKAKLTKQIGRLVGGEDNTVINPTEGIVFSYKGKLMKLTGSFGPLNQILGSIKFGR